jgi:hypothetical protein
LFSLDWILEKCGGRLEKQMPVCFPRVLPPFARNF